MSGIFRLIDKLKKYDKEIERLINIAEEDRNYGRYKKYGGKIKFEKYLSRLYGMNEVCKGLMEEVIDE